MKKTTDYLNSIPISPGIRLALAMVVTTSTSLAITWDTSSDAGFQPSDGDWSATDTNWSTDGTALVGWVNPDLAAEFSGPDGDYFITLTETINAAGLVFNNSGNTLAGGQVLDLKSGGSNVTLVAGTTNTIGIGLKLLTFSGRLGQNEGVAGGTLNIGSDGTYEARGSASISLDGLGTTLNISGLVDTVNGRFNLGNNKIAPASGTTITDVTAVVKSGGRLEVAPEATQIGYSGNYGEDAF